MACKNCCEEHGPMDPRLDDYDWKEAFKYASAPEAYPGQAAIDRRGFARVDVAEVLHIVNGDADGPEWVGVFRLSDGRFAVLRAGCDYSGWRCQEGGSSAVTATLDEALRFGLTEEDRRRLAIVLPAGTR